MRRSQKLAETLREGVTQIVGYELEDPRVVGVTVTDVRVAGDKRDARIFVTITGEGGEASDKETRDALAALRHAAPFVRRQIAFIYDLPFVPQLHFVRDTVEERAARVDALLMDLQRERAAGADDAQTADQTSEQGEAPPRAATGHDETGDARVRGSNTA